ncbi:hypothetical protein FSP39_000364, partial [Pinctada imbricata]
QSSWNSYIDNLIAQSKDVAGNPHCDKAIIIGLDGGAPWTTNDHDHALKLHTSERENIARAFKSKNFTSFKSNGISIEGVLYQFIREEKGKIVMVKKKEHGSVTLQATKTAVVIAHCPERRQQGQLNIGVGVVANYIESLGM